MAGGLYGMNRLPRDSVRARRNATQLASNFTSLLGDGLVVGGAGLITIDLAANPGLEFSGGDLTAKVAAPIALDATGIHLDYGTGLQNDAGVLKTNDAAIDHDALLNFAGNEHFLQTAITNISSALATGLVKVTTGTGALSVVTDNTANWDVAFTHVSNDGTDHGYIDQDVKVAASPTFAGVLSTGPIVLDDGSGDSPGIFFRDEGDVIGYINKDVAFNALHIHSDDGILLTATSGEISFEDDNLTTTGTITGEQITSTDDITMAGILTNTLAATDEDGIFVDGFTNDYTGASHGYAGRFMRDYDFGTGTLSEFITLFVEANHKSSDAKMTASKSIASIKSNMILGGKFTQNQTTGKNFYDKAFFLTVDDNAVYDTSSTGPFYINHRAGEFTIDNDATYTDSGGSNPYTRVINVGGFFQVNASPTLISGSVTVLNRGVMIDVTGTIVGSQTNVGMYIDRVSGADTNWGIWDASGANWALDGDNQKILWGEGQDASIQYDGTDLLINSHEVGSGHIVLDSPKTTTGDPAGVEGKVYWNTMDNVIRMYADGAWRTLASW